MIQSICGYIQTVEFPVQAMSKENYLFSQTKEELDKYLHYLPEYISKGDIYEYLNVINTLEYKDIFVELSNTNSIKFTCVLSNNGFVTITRIFEEGVLPPDYVLVYLQEYQWGELLVWDVLNIYHLIEVLNKWGKSDESGNTEILQ